MSKVQEILDRDDPVELKGLFSFNATDADAAVLFKFNLWGRKYHAKYFSSKDADFHRTIDANNLKIYRGTIDYFVNVAFKGAAKTARTKLFIAFCIANDMEHRRKYIKVLSEDDTNSTQIVTDVYNMLIQPGIKRVYPEIFEKTETKREEKMDSFTTATGIKMISMTVGTSQRGALQEEARPDFIWFEDFENRKTLRSARITKAIWDNMEEARTGLAKGGGCVYTCNYISEQGSVHKLVTEKLSARKVVFIQSILDEQGEPVWSRYSKAEVEQMKVDDDDFEGERLCKPSASKDIYFDREMLDKMPHKTPIRESASFKIFKEFNPSHRYASGHDVAGGVGLDSSTSVFIDFDVLPAQVVATFKSNTIKEDVFGDEIYRESNFYGGCLAAPEDNNYGHSTIARLKQLEQNMYAKPAKESNTKTGAATVSPVPVDYGWNTNTLTKGKMLVAMQSAIERGLIELNDASLIQEFKSYTRNDLLENVKDPRDTTRHFDLLIGCAIAWQMNAYATVQEVKEEYVEEPEEVNYPQIWGGGVQK